MILRPELGRYRTLLLTAALALLALPSFAGVSYEAVTETTSDNARPMKTLVTAQIEGDKGRIEFKESTGNPVLGAGNYLVTEDGAKTVYLVNPEEKTYSTWDLDAMMRFAGSVMEGMGGLMKMEFSDPEVEKLLDEDGGTLLGLPVRHVRHRISYSMQMKVLGMKRNMETEIIQDQWVTNALPDAAFGAWLRDDPPATGNENLDGMIRGLVETTDGYPLKSVQVTTNRDKKGKESISRTVMEVTRLDRDAPAAPAASYQVPEGYKEQPLLPESDEEGNPFGGLLKGQGGR